MPARHPEIAKARRENGKYWTRERITEAFRSFHQGMGRPPAVFDTQFRGVAASREMTEGRIQEAERAHDLGLRLPAPDIVRREFGGWADAIIAAGMKPAAKMPKTKVKANRESMVCPSCGDFRWYMDAVTGWCTACTREHSRLAA